MSRLLAENLALREEKIQAQAEREEALNRRVIEDVDSIRIQLETQVVEFSRLLGEMCVIGRKPGRRKSYARQDSHAAIIERPLGNAPVDSSEDKLPTIVEGKHYPRRTLEYVYRKEKIDPCKLRQS